MGATLAPYYFAMWGLRGLSHVGKWEPLGQIRNPVNNQLETKSPLQMKEKAGEKKATSSIDRLYRRFLP
eukprot:4957337-Amphidinium_carterae.1